ncbi:unnamed protein product [Polarella glacialis]|uniref:Uncharacterized protein n=2 Tax=Polarella glacialis TaxID=89957 RepID=A0A813DIV5_POLGL|nr:unnamed protein product [Polarella glacialis]
MMGALGSSLAMGGSSSGSSATCALSRPPKDDLQNGSAPGRAAQFSPRNLSGRLSPRNSSAREAASLRPSSVDSHEEHHSSQSSKSPRRTLKSTPQPVDEAEQAPAVSQPAAEARPGHPGQPAASSARRAARSVLGFLPRRSSSVGSTAAGRQGPVVPDVDFLGASSQRRSAEVLPGRFERVESRRGEGEREGPPTGERQGFNELVLAAEAAAAEEAAPAEAALQAEPSRTSNLFGRFSRRSQRSVPAAGQRRASSALPLPSGNGSGRFSTLWRRPGPTDGTGVQCR